MKPGVLFLAAIAAFAQQPDIENTRVETRAVPGTLESAMKSLIAGRSGAAWIGYAVPIVPGERQVCGWESHTRASNHLSLEGPTALFVMYRVEEGRTGKVRIASPDCRIDAGGVPVIWLTNVVPEQSVRYLESLVTASKLDDAAISAIALHQDPAADRALDALASPSRPESIRRKAVFWMGVARGARGFDRLKQILAADPSDKVREHAMFAISQSKDAGAIPFIIRIAHEDRSPHVRGQALFWLAQSAQKKIAAEAIAGAIENDPETDVKRKAVFALSQLPNGEGVTKLIEVARTNRNREVRKQALFWLGQSNDSRALQFLEEVLAR
jgi:hypothetical protein